MSIFDGSFFFQWSQGFRACAGGCVSFHRGSGHRVLHDRQVPVAGQRLGCCDRKVFRFPLKFDALTFSAELPLGLAALGRKLLFLGRGLCDSGLCVLREFLASPDYYYYYFLPL